MVWNDEGSPRQLHSIRNLSHQRFDWMLQSSLGRWSYICRSVHKFLRKRTFHHFLPTGATEKYLQSAYRSPTPAQVSPPPQNLLILYCISFPTRWHQAPRLVVSLWGSVWSADHNNIIMLFLLHSLNLEHHLAEYEYWADEFEQLPIYFMGFHGQSDVHTVVKVHVRSG